MVQPSSHIGNASTIAPILGGGLFWLTVLADHWLYRRQWISVGFAGLMEAVALLIALTLFYYGVRAVVGFIRSRQMLNAVLTLCALALGIVLLIQGFAAGAALLTAT